MILSQFYWKRHTVWSDEKLGRLYYSTDDRINKKISSYITPSSRVLMYDEQDLSSADYLPGSYDIVILRSLESTPHRDELLSRIHDLLNPGGLLLAAGTCLGEPISGVTLHQWYHERSRKDPLLYYDTFRSLRKRIECFGFCILEEEELCTWMPQLFLATQKKIPCPS